MLICAEGKMGLMAQVSGSVLIVVKGLSALAASLTLLWGCVAGVCTQPSAAALFFPGRYSLSDLTSLLQLRRCWVYRLYLRIQGSVAGGSRPCPHTHTHTCTHTCVCIDAALLLLMHEVWVLTVDFFFLTES